jgi:D-3-phosphoglycerate dehydrogenase
VFGGHGINIVSAAVGRQPEGQAADAERLAAMVITTDAPVPPEVIDEIASGEGFVAGRAVSL